jgi:hypothetical protein
MKPRSMFGACVVLTGYVVACAPEEITVASVPADENGEHPDHPPSRCATNDECRRDEFCAKSTCDAVAGICEHRPNMCIPEGGAVCGCDGVTYFDDCLRRTLGVSLAGTTECGSTAMACEGPGTGGCPAGTYCARLLPPGTACGQQEMGGTCWALPAVCTTGETADRDRWLVCDAQPPSCLDTCNAIRTNAVLVRARGCP